LYIPRGAPDCLNICNNEMAFTSKEENKPNDLLACSTYFWKSSFHPTSPSTTN
jgi:hypothetical protein